MNYCDECIHFSVCKYVKDLKKYEEKPAVYGGELAEGPSVRYQIDCPMKRIDNSKPGKEEFNYGVSHCQL